MDVFAMRQLKLREERIVGVCDLGKLAAGNGKNFVGTVDGRHLRGDVSRLRDVVIIDHQTAADWPGYFSTRNRYAAKVLGAIVIGDKVNEPSVRRKVRLRAHAVERFSENFSLASVQRDDREMPGAVFEH